MVAKSISWVKSGNIPPLNSTLVQSLFTKNSASFPFRIRTPIQIAFKERAWNSLADFQICLFTYPLVEQESDWFFHGTTII